MEHYWDHILLAMFTSFKHGMGVNNSTTVRKQSKEVNGNNPKTSIPTIRIIQSKYRFHLKR